MTDEERRAEALAIAHEQREEAQREEARRPSHSSACRPPSACCAAATDPGSRSLRAVAQSEDWQRLDGAERAVVTAWLRRVLGSS